MNPSLILKNIENNNLPVHIFSTGEVTHLIVGKIVRGDGQEIDAVCLIAEKRKQASEEFKQILAATKCQCGKQKIENMPLCGICYGNLRTGIKSALRRTKGVQLENMYHFALESLGYKSAAELKHSVTKKLWRDK